MLLTIEDRLWHNGSIPRGLAFLRIRHIALLDIKSLRANVPRLHTLLLIILIGFFVLVFQGLSVISSRETPHDVLRRRLIHVFLQVMKGMLCYICKAHVLVPPNDSRLWLQLTDQELDCRRLTSTVGANNSNSRGHASCEAHMLDRVLL